MSLFVDSIVPDLPRQRVAVVVRKPDGCVAAGDVRIVETRGIVGLQGFVEILETIGEERFDILLPMLIHKVLRAGSVSFPYELTLTRECELALRGR
jgi:hypothetical protein